MERIEVTTNHREQMVDVTARVDAVVRKSGIAEGWALAYCPHTTAGMTINENADPDVAHDILGGLADLVPRGKGWRHIEGNADSHLKAALVGSSVTVPITGGRLALGTWQGIYFCEFDGPRSRALFVQVTGA